MNPPMPAARPVANPPFQPAESRQLRILVACHQPITRRGLRCVLEEDPELAVVGEAQNGRQMVAACHTLRPDIVIVDSDLPYLDATAASCSSGDAGCRTRVLVLRDDHDHALCQLPGPARAAGSVSKAISRSELRGAVKAALFGPRPSRRTCPVVRFSGAPARAPLSVRERDVLQLLALGLTNRQIAERLVVSTHTIKAHVQHILMKLGVKDRTEAAVRAVDFGLLPGARVTSTETSSAA